MYRSRISFSHTHWLMTDRWEPESSPGVGGSARVSPWRRQEAAGRKHNQAFRSRQRSPWHRHGNRLDRPRPRRCHVSWRVSVAYFQPFTSGCHFIISLCITENFEQEILWHYYIFHSGFFTSPESSSAIPAAAGPRTQSSACRTEENIQITSRI